MVHQKIILLTNKWQALHDLVRVLMMIYPQREVVGHCDLDPDNKPNCPGFDVGEWFAEEFIGLTHEGI